uniref:Nucleoprotein n=1 Tax=Melilotus virus 1_Off TaxID=2977976 RepID=A0A9N6YJG1_9RHAB|nr:TPA_asm: nucleocapsid protein [Melilotus virus 1_Off]
METEDILATLQSAGRAVRQSQEELPENELRIDRQVINKKTQRDNELAARIMHAVQTRKVAQKFTDIADISTTMDVVTSWEDDELGQLKTVRVRRISRGIDSLAFAEQTFIDLHTRLTEEIIGKLFYLAYNLRDQVGRYVFSPFDERLCDYLSEVHLEELSKKPILTSIDYTPVRTLCEDHDEERIEIALNAYCFVAASYFRLFTRDASNYAPAGAKIASTFYSMYKQEFLIENFHPGLPVIEAVKLYMGSHDLMKNTFYNMLYSGDVNPHGREIKAFLYRTHVKYTGLHCFTLFTRVADAYKLSGNELANHLNIRKFATELSNIKMLINNCSRCEKGETPKIMWKYARIFDTRFFSTLQTKNCKEFVATLGFMLQGGQGGRENEDVMRIAQIQKLSQNDLNHCSSLADAARAFILHEQADNHMEGIVKII